MELFFLKMPIFKDLSLYICVITLIILLWHFNRSKDYDMKYFIFADISFIIGEITYDVISIPFNVPADTVFFILFYLCLFLFLKNRNKSLFKNPAFKSSPVNKMTLLLVIDFLITGIIAYIIYYYFDRMSFSTQINLSDLNYPMLINLIYPVLDFLLLAYYLYINKIYVVDDNKLYIPITLGVLIWTIGDFIYSFEVIFNINTYKLTDYMQAFELVVLAIVILLIKRYSASNYSTLDLPFENTGFGNFTTIVNWLDIVYMAICIYYFIRYANSARYAATIIDFGFLLLALTIIRLTALNHFIQTSLSKLEKDVSADPLTGLYSRKYAFSLMQSLFKSSLYFNISISALMLDIDHFKKFNDTWGHVIGDRVLREIAQLICNSIETSKIVCRYGGEEFLIILPGIDEKMGSVIAENIRQNIENYKFYDGKKRIKTNVTVSIGGSTADRKTRNEIDLIEQADMALYLAKEERNKSAWFSKLSKVRK
ncbi:MAG: GGDEF domain-containing protein [Bacillota bacterium]|nr:GGDEF domain-containing protein [Bacillota bacterium]